MQKAIARRGEIPHPNSFRRVVSDDIILVNGIDAKGMLELHFHNGWCVEGSYWCVIRVAARVSTMGNSVFPCSTGTIQTRSN